MVVWWCGLLWFQVRREKGEEREESNMDIHQMDGTEWVGCCCYLLCKLKLNVCDGSGV